MDSGYSSSEHRLQLPNPWLQLPSGRREEVVAPPSRQLCCDLAGGKKEEGICYDLAEREKEEGICSGMAARSEERRVGKECQP